MLQVLFQELLECVAQLILKHGLAHMMATSKAISVEVLMGEASLQVFDWSSIFARVLFLQLHFVSIAILSSIKLESQTSKH